MTLPNTTVLQGVPVVPGVRFAPVIRTNRLPAIDALDSGAVLAELDRPAEAARFANAASTVAQRLRDRAATATCAASEVLGATAQLAQDRAWLGSAENAISKPVRRRCVPLPMRPPNSSRCSPRLAA